MTNHRYLEQMVRRVLTILKGRQGRSYLARVRLVKRGVFPLGPTVIATGDLFGLFPVEQEIAGEDSLLVYPMMVDVRGFPNPPGLLPGGEALRRRTHQVTPNAAGVREYTTGDPLNRIHWLSTARRGRLIVKEFELDPLADVWIFLDAAENVQAALPQAHLIYTQKIYGATQARSLYHHRPKNMAYASQPHWYVIICVGDGQWVWHVPGST